MPTARIRDIDVYFERAGVGAPVLFVGGSGGDLRQRPNVLEGPLAADFDVLAYDQRGLGRTSVPDDPYSMADYADDAAALLEHVAWPACSVVGVSFGGMVGQELALRHPDRVSRLVLCCTSSGGEGGASYPLHTLRDLPAEERARRSIALADTRMGEALERDQPERFARILEGVRDRNDTGAGEAGREDGARLQMEARRQHDTWARLPELRLPVYLCGGRHDGIAPPENMQAMAARIPGAKLDLFEGGHMFLIQDKTAWQRIAAFLSSPA